MSNELYSSLITHYSSLRARYGLIVLWACFFYLAHLVFQSRTAGSELGAVAATWIASAGLWEYYALKQHDLEHRITGLSTHVMTFSGLLLPFSLLFGILWLHERKWWMFVPAVLASFALLLTFTRSAWLAWTFAIFVVLILPRPRWIVYALAALVLVVT